MQTITITITDDAALVVWYDGDQTQRLHILGQEDARTLLRGVDNQLLNIALAMTHLPVEDIAERNNAAMKALIEAGIAIPGMTPPADAIPGHESTPPADPSVTAPKTAPKKAPSK